VKALPPFCKNDLPGGVLFFRAIYIGLQGHWGTVQGRGKRHVIRRALPPNKVSGYEAGRSIYRTTRRI
jgi:hypothetical protein